MSIPKIERLLSGGFETTDVATPGFIIPTGATAISMPLTTDWIQPNSSNDLSP